MSFITWKPDTEIIKQTIEKGLVLNSQISSDNINMTLTQDSIFLKDLCDFLNIDNNFSYLNTCQINKDLIKNAFNSACVKIFDKRTNDIEKIEGQLYFFKDEVKLYSVYKAQWIEIPFLLNNPINSTNISTKVITTPNETINIDLNLLIERAPNTPLYVLMFGGGGNGSHYGGGGGGDFEYFTIEDTVNNPVDYLSVTV